VQAAERFADFHRLRAELRGAYGELLAATAFGSALGAEDLDLRTDLLFGLTESVILIRRAAPGRDPSGLADATADAALRVAGTAERSLPKLRREGQGLVAARR
jgi:hypothetical protein